MHQTVHQTGQEFSSDEGGIVAVYHYNGERSTDPDDQVAGLQVDAATVGGELEADSAADAWAAVKSVLPLPGVWVISMRRGRRWLRSRRFRVARRSHA